jgi:hypothetical protein
VKTRARTLASLLAVCTLAIACEDEKKETPPAPSAAASASASVSAQPSASASAAPAPALDPAGFCARVFGSVYDDFVKSCSDDDKKSDGYKLAMLVATMPLEECNFVVRDGVAAGRMTFDASAAAACVEAAAKTKRAMKSVHLATPDIDELTECKSVVTGKQTDGQACRSTFECVLPLTCVGSKQKQDGVCKAPPAAAGEACDGSIWRFHDFGHRRRCGAGLACNSVDSATAKVVCRKAVAKGGACVESDECEEGLVCHAGKCDSGPPAVVDGPCDDDTDDCADGLYCKRDKGAKLGKCAEKKAAGKPCSDVFECRGECRKGDKGPGTCAAVCGSG